MIFDLIIRPSINIILCVTFTVISFTEKIELFPYILLYLLHLILIYDTASSLHWIRKLNFLKGIAKSNVSIFKNGKIKKV